MVFQVVRNMFFHKMLIDYAQMGIFSDYHDSH